jgi:5-methylcytosine-specific restriction enzyme A
VCTVQLVDDHGRALDAEYTVEPDGSSLALIMASRSGMSGSRSPRNPDYNQALTILLERLSQLDAVLVDALVDSRRTQQLGLPGSDRRLIAAPIRLAQVPDMETFRRGLGGEQARIAQAPDATKGGNSTKRIRLRLEVPGYQPSDAARLEGLLTAPITVTVPTFILAWHPLHFLWQEQDYDQAIQVTAGGQTWHDDWTVGVRTGGINPGDRAFLYRQYQDRGLVASGIFTSGVYTSPHWDGSGRLARYAQLDWTNVLDYEDRLPIEQLKAEVPEVKWGRIQGSGIAVPPASVPKLHDLWAHHTSTVLFRSPDEPREAGGQAFPEGALSRVEVNRYERDPRARKACLNHWGYRCAVCGFSFEEGYGPLGQDFIHVHHLLELSKVPPGYQVDPVNDLRPLCPNCHAMIHRGTGPALSIDELRGRLRR